jgi:hypothetical protein
VDGFFDHLCTPFGTTSNYSAIADLHTLQITTASTKSSPSCSVFNSRSLATTSKSGDSSASLSQVLLLQSSAQNSTELSVNSLLQTVLLIISRQGPHIKHPVSIVVVQLLKLPSNGNAFIEPLPRKVLVNSRISRSLHSYSCTRYNIECSRLTINCWLTL